MACLPFVIWRWKMINTRVPKNLHSHEVTPLVDDVGNGLTNAIWRRWQRVFGDGLKDYIQRIWWRVVGDGLKDVIQRIWQRVVGDGLKDAIWNNVDFMRYSFVGTPIPVVEEDSAEECWSLFWEIEFRSFSCPLLYWGVISWLKRRKWTAIWSGSRLHSDLLMIIRLTAIRLYSRLHNELLGKWDQTVIWSYSRLYSFLN